MQQSTPSPRRHRAARRLDQAAPVIYGSFVLAVVVSVTDPEHTPISMIGFTVLWLLAQLAGMVFAARAGWRRTLDGRTRRAWWMIFAALVVFTASNVARGVQPVGESFPSVADVLRLSFVPIMLVGLAFLPLRTQGRHDRHKIWLDTGIVVTATGMLLWYLQVEPAVTRSELSASALAAVLAYPAGDLALIFAAVMVIMRGTASSARRSVSLLAAGIFSLTVGDVYLGYQASHAAAFTARPWQFTCWLFGSLLLCAAGYEQCRQASGHRLASPEKPVRSSVTRLPYLAIVLGFALLVATTLRLGVFALSGLVIGAVVLTALVVGRQILAQQETHQLAVTDALTGLANRRRLDDALRLALARGVRSGQHVAVILLDMNGFKQVNDSLGHDAGDQLLILFGGLLRRNVLGADLVGRLGGDEFAIVLHNIGSPSNAVAVAERILAAMRQPLMIDNQLVLPRASLGIAITSPGELSAEELMHRADLAMYRSKQCGTGYETYREELAPHHTGDLTEPPGQRVNRPPVARQG